MQRRKTDRGDLDLLPPHKNPRRRADLWQTVRDHPVVTGVAVALVYALVSKSITMLSAFSNSGLAISTFWPLAGITVVAVLATRPRWWPWLLGWVFAVETLMDAIAGVPWSTAAGWGVADTVEPLVSASLLLWLGLRRLDLSRTRDLLRFIACAVLAGPAVGALTSGLLTALTGFGQFGETTLRWFAGDFVGVLVVAPAMLAVLNRGASPRKASMLPPMMLLLVVTPAAFASPLGQYPAVPYMVVPVLVWLSVRAGAAGAAYGVLAVSLLVNVVSALGKGPFAATIGPFQGLISAEAFLGSAAFSALIVGALTSDLLSRDDVEGQLRHQATHDPLTGLPNRRLFVDELEQAARHRAAGHPVGIVYVDLNGFKEVNDMFGHDVGDDLLIETAVRLTVGVRDGDMVARLGGDEFAVLLPYVDSLDEASAVAARLSARLAAPVTIGHYRIETEAAVGVAVSEDPHEDPDLLLTAADYDMFAQKERMPVQPRLVRDRVHPARRAPEPG